MRDAYRDLVTHLGVDTVVLVDGGTDILLRGDEAELGTPEEDMTSLASVAALDGVDRLVVSLGFGIEPADGCLLQRRPGDPGRRGRLPGRPGHDQHRRRRRHGRRSARRRPGRAMPH
ncbi:DUF1152 domain-containing protein [Amycolatopsis sp., V23-08]|uniref:DUF1152 domain-containing protein n=1 Tax=Amycolatopsis heterodermiae TaxID=3110235 RepID=A0ABU5RAN1_9PSEU|nr:DUF1152 domain-containing protein [Amycolatopsis sp., V23-08]MEA5362900.1 DUF1152 domain-containing protein [Amycolatopsis sp., V23-08]